MFTKFFILFMTMSLCCPQMIRAAEEEAPAKKTSTQNIGGLLFDVDEGVKVEQGPGGSVYVKSNREYMQEKFAEIDQKFSELEARLAKLESEGKEQLFSKLKKRKPVRC